MDSRNEGFFNLGTESVSTDSRTEHDAHLENAIAIIGMSCRFPGANSPDEFWTVLADGTDCIVPLPEDRPLAVPEYEKLNRPQNYMAGFLKCPIDEFDAHFFGISPREAPFLDPQQRLLLEVSWEALEDAGINPQSLKSSQTGVFVGIWTQYYDRIIPSEMLTVNEIHHKISGNLFSATASRLSYFLGLYGPNIAIESGCSSSLAALHLACSSLRQGESPLAIVSGVNLIVDPTRGPFTGITDSIVLSKTKRCHTFDAAADGFVRADGCGALILKKYSKAKKDGDNIQAIIRGSAMNNDGAGYSFGTPNGDAQERVIRSALSNAGVHPWNVSYVEAHGTGTVAGDPIEVKAIGNVYSKNRTTPLLLGSVKSNIGHTESCAGIAGVIKIILSMKNGAIPPNLHFNNLNPALDIDRIPATIPVVLTGWNEERKIAGVSSFSMSATNVHALIQEPFRAQLKSMEDVQTTSTGSNGREHLVQLSAKSPESLKNLVSNYVKFLKTSPQISLESISYGTTICRAKFSHRYSIVTETMEELTEKLEQALYTVPFHTISKKPKIAFLFTGQGSQYLGMGKNLYENSPAFRTAMDDCAKQFDAKFGQSLFRILWSTEDQELLNETIYCQPAIFCFQCSLVRHWHSLGLEPDLVLGHSIGEYASAVAAGILSFEDGFDLVAERSRLVETLQPGRMLAIKASASEVESVESCIAEFTRKNPKDWIDVATINSPEEVVVSGEIEAIEKFQKFCNSEKLSTKLLQASHAFHSRHMDQILKKFEKFAAKIRMCKPSKSYISGTLGRSMNFAEFTPSYWSYQLRSTVNFDRAIQTARLDDVLCFLEIGPQPILLSLAINNFGSEASSFVFCPSLRKTKEDRTTVLTTCSKLFSAGVDLDMSSWFGLQSKATVSLLPKYPFQRQKYWYTEHESKAQASSSVAIKHSEHYQGLGVHPLLGLKCVVAESLPIFHKTIDISVSPLKFLSDHRVSGKIIYPAAAQLESILAAGSQVLHGAGTQLPCTVENVKVNAPLDVETPCALQVTVTRINDPETTSYSIGIYKQDKNEKWKNHSRAAILPRAKLQSGRISLESVKLRLKHTTPEQLFRAYTSIATRGIQFGPQFMSVSSAWTQKEGNTTEILTETVLPDEYRDYICHPIVLDAMIQTFCFCDEWRGLEVSGIKLPVGIKKFCWFAQHELTPLVYSYAIVDDDSSQHGNIMLYNSNGDPLACMQGIEMLPTTEHAFLRALRAVDEELPDFMTTIWRPSASLTEKRIPIEAIYAPIINANNIRARGTPEATTHVNPQRNTLPDVANDLVEVNNPSYLVETLKSIGSYEKEGWIGLGKLGSVVVLAFLRSIFQIAGSEIWGDKPLNLDSIKRKLSPTFRTTKFVDAGFQKLQLEGYVTCIKSAVYSVKKVLSMKEIDFLLERLMKEAISVSGQDATIAYARRVIENMTDVLSGNLTALEILFPEDRDAFGVPRLYTEAAFYVLNSDLIVSYLLDFVSIIHTENSKQKIQILEVGGGTGATTEILLRKLTQLKIPFDYTFTDISQSFVSNAHRNFSHYENVFFETLDIEKDPLVQNFGPQSFDFIIGLQVLHATQNLVETLSNLNTLLRTGGWLMLAELFQDVPLLSLSFGLLDSWWGFTDSRKFSPISSVDSWKRYLSDTGFGSSEVIEIFDGTMGAIYTTKMRHLPGKCATAGLTWLIIDDGSQLCNVLAEKLQKQNRRIRLINFASEIGLTILDSEIRLYFDQILASMEILEGIIFFCTDDTTEPIPCAQERICGILIQLWKSIVDYNRKFIHSPRFFVVTRGLSVLGDSEPVINLNAATLCGAMRSFSNENPEIRSRIIDFNSRPELPTELDQIFSELWTSGNERELLIAFREKKRNVQRLIPYEKPSKIIQMPQSAHYTIVNPVTKLIQDFQITPTTKCEPVDDQVVIAVKATALNFYDLFMVLKPEGFHVPLGRSISIGLDVSGTVVSIGANVRKFKVGDEVIAITFDGGFASHVSVLECTVIPKPKALTFASAATIPCAFLTAYHCLVELAQISERDNVLIHVATGGVGLAAIQIARLVGAEIYATAGSNRKRAYLRSFGIKYVYDSRTTSFGDAIFSDCGGPKITIVLNSLTGPGFKEQSLRICAQNAHFLEIGKVHIWQPQEIKHRREDVKYFIIDLIDMTIANPSRVGRMLENIYAEFQNGNYRPLPHIIFPLEQVREAFQYFQEAKHIGKVVIQNPKVTIDISGQLTLRKQLFDPQGTYLITGGLGGIGIEVAKWMRTSGAVFIVLVGRNRPSDQAEALITTWNKEGSQIMTMQADVGDYENCEQLLQKIRQTLPPLRGIFHAAGLLSDAMLPHQSWEKFEYTLRPKAYGAWNLHVLTQSDDLDYFVLFSSMSAILGSIGQSNHAAGNRYLDALAHYRVSRGLSATTINWGAWSDVGAASNMKIGQEGAYGIQPFTPRQGIASLEYILSHGLTQMTVIYVSDWKLVRQTMPLGNFYSEIQFNEKEKLSTGLERLAEEIKNSKHGECQMKNIQDYLQILLKDTLKLSSLDQIHPERNFSELGVDSLMTMEVRNHVQCLVKQKTISLVAMNDHQTIQSLSTYLTNLINSD